MVENNAGPAKIPTRLFVPPINGVRAHDSATCSAPPQIRRIGDGESFEHKDRSHGQGIDISHVTSELPMTNTALCSGGGGGPQANGICYAHTSQGIGKNNGKAIYFSVTGI